MQVKTGKQNMKKTTLLLVSVLASTAAFSQVKEIKNTIKFNAITLFKQVYDVQYERVLDEKSSVQFGIAFGNYESTDINKVQDLHLDNFGRTLNNPKNGALTENIFALNVDYKYYYMKTNAAPKGLYLSPSVQYLKSKNTFGAMEQREQGNSDGSFDFKERKYTEEVNVVNVRALIGCQLIIAKLVTVNPYVGPSYAFGNAKEYNDKEDSSAKGLLFNYGLYVGVVF